MSRLLLADIGGTNARFACADGGAVAARERRDTASIKDFPSVIAELVAGWGPVDRVMLAVAGPVAEGVVPMPNAHLVIDAADVTAAANAPVRLLNDFEALAWAAPSLGAADRLEICQGAPGAADRHAGCPIAVTGPGTGLGVCAWVPFGPEQPARGRGLVTEGGHATLAARTAEEEKVLAAMRARFGHVSAERVLSGSGLALLHETLTGAVLAPDAIAAAALAGDPHAQATMALYFAFLGTVAGDVALTYGSRAGLYLAGGILPKVADLLQASDFATRFADKGRFSGYLAEIPVWLITADEAAFTGLMAAARD
jgi:glucokinase